MATWLFVTALPARLRTACASDPDTTYIHAVSENTGPLHPAEHGADGVDVDQYPWEDHHEHPDEGRQDRRHRVVVDRRAEEERDRCAGHTRQQDVQHEEQEAPDVAAQTWQQNRHSQEKTSCKLRPPSCKTHAKTWSCGLLHPSFFGFFLRVEPVVKVRQGLAAAAKCGLPIIQYVMEANIVTGTARMGNTSHSSLAMKYTETL